MLKEWNKFRGWKVLSYFLENPNTKIHIKGLARKLKISSKTAKDYCDIYAKDRIFKKEKIANSIRFYLNNEEIIVKELKKLWFLSILREQKVIEELLRDNKGIICVALYGAYASGEYTNESDIDILIIAQTEKLDVSQLSEFGHSIRKETSVTKFKLGKWRELLKRKNSFTESVLKNHIILWGGELG